jgi:biopolymer transport protein ExbD/biopolymer transport protein TolR
MIGGRLGGGVDDGLPVRAEINVTSLVDVAFTLLVIFMITAPILQGGVYVEDDPFTREEFSATIVQLVERKGGPTVYVKGDRDVPYGSVLWVIGKLKEAEIDAVSLIAEPDTDR